jgi:hypothetical protein
LAQKFDQENGWRTAFRLIFTGGNAYHMAYHAGAWEPGKILRQKRGHGQTSLSMAPVFHLYLCFDQPLTVNRERSQTSIEEKIP